MGSIPIGALPSFYKDKAMNKTTEIDDYLNIVKEINRLVLELPRTKHIRRQLMAREAGEEHGYSEPIEIIKSMALASVEAYVAAHSYLNSDTYEPCKKNNVLSQHCDRFIL
jgi:hypothetical protein